MKDERMRINQHRINKYRDTPFILFVLFTCTYFVYNDFDLSGTISLGLCVFIVASSFIIQLGKEKRGESLKLDSIRLSFIWVAIVMFLNFLRFDSEQSHTNIYYIASILVCASMLLLSNPEHSVAEKTLNIFLKAGLAIAIFVIFFSLFEELYRTMIYPFLGETRKEYSDLTYASGYGVSLGGVTYTANMLVMGIAIVNGNRISIKKRSKMFVFQQLLLFGILLLALLFLGRKGELVSMLLAYIIIWVINSIIMRGKIKKSSFIIISASFFFFIMALIFLLPLFLKAGLLDRYILFFQNFKNGKDITSGRVQLWRWGWELFTQHPVFGGGLGSYNKYIPQSARVTGSGTQVSSPHIVYLHILCEFGIVGFFLILFPMGYILYKTLQQYLRLTKSQKTNVQDEVSDRTICFNAVSLFMQFFFVFLFFFDQTFSLVHYWLLYCVAIYLSSTAFNSFPH